MSVIAGFVSRQSDDAYNALERYVSQKVASLTSPLFRTAAPNLFAAYLDGLPGERQLYNCRCCEIFIQRYGSLVTLDESGHATSAIWPQESEAPEFFRQSTATMRAIVASATVTGVFLSSDETFGRAVSKKGWTHLSGKNPLRFAHAVLVASQREAELREDHRILSSSLADYSIEQVNVALQVLKSEQFPGYEKGLGIAEWYLGLKTKLAESRNNRHQAGIVWRAVATAPPGYAHVHNTMVGTLLDDVKAGKCFEDCRRAWADKMHPLRYQRPTAAVSEGQIRVAEALVEKLGVANSLKRTYAKLEQVKSKLWEPRESESEPVGGVFGHLNPKAAGVSMSLPDQKMTWAKFERDILPTAMRMEVNCPAHGAFVGIVTAEDDTAPPILQWDNVNDRNPMSHYFYVNGSAASQWEISSGWHPVAAICPAPHGNHDGHHRSFLVFCVAAMHDTNGLKVGAGLFPEFLKNELREIRAVVEAHSKKSGISGRGTANGLAFQDANAVTVRVNGVATYTIDRWE